MTFSMEWLVIKDTNFMSDILIVDDLPDNLEILYGYLKEEHYNVRLAESGQAALEAVQINAPDLILLDIRMPDIDGFEVCRRLKADDVTKDIPIIFVTAANTPEEKVKGLTLGAVDYIEKPFDEYEVLARVKTHLKLHHLTKHYEKEFLETESKYKRLIEGLEDEYFFYTQDIDGHVTYVSRSVTNVLGYTKKEVHNQHYKKFLTDHKVNEDAIEKIEHSLKGIAQSSFEVEAFHKNGTKVWLAVKNTPRFDDSGKVIELEAIIHDITRQKTFQNELIISQERLKEAQSLGKMGHWELDHETDTLTWSDEVFKIFGLDSEKFGASYEAFSAAIHPDDREMVDTAYTYAVEHNVPYDIFHRIIRADNREVRYVHEHSIEITRDNNKIYSVGTVQDVTERYENEKKLQKALVQTVQAISRTIELRDPYTAGHQTRVSDLACAIAKKMHCSETFIEGLQLGATIHDIGKITVPAEILSRPGRLSDVEFELIKQHAESGHNIIKNIDFPWPITDMVYQHHERLDGSGYPNGLKGDEISLEAQIISVADTVEAIASHRPYRPGLGIDTALEEIKNLQGKCFREDIVTACLKLFEEGYRLSE